MNAFVLSRARTLQWGAAFIAVCYHLRFLLFADYAHVRHRGIVLIAFYFLSSLGHEAFLVYMGTSGLLFGALSMPRGRAGGGAAALDALSVRLRSLYFLLVPALLLGGLLDALGSTAFADSGVYGMVPQFQPEHLSARTLAGNLLLLQDVAVQGYGSNAMLFLLTYEWWACAACTAYALGRGSGPGRGLLAWMSVAGTMAYLAPQFCGYAGAWLAGLAASRSGAWARGRIAAPRGVVCCIVAIVISRLAGARLATMPQELVPAGRVLLDIAASFGIGAYLLSLHEGAVARQLLPLRLLQHLTRLAPALLALHFPMMLFVVAVASQFGLSLQAQPAWSGALAFVAMVAVLCLCALGFAAAIAALRRALGHLSRSCHRHAGAGGLARTSGPAPRAPPG